MGKLVVFLDGKQVGEYMLSKERMTLGRKPFNDIQLDHATVSSEHALFVTIRQDSFLEDLGSTNGVRVNRKTVKKCALQDGDEIRIGKFIIKYSAQASMVEPGDEPTIIAGQVNPLTGKPMSEDAAWLEDKPNVPSQTLSMHTTLPNVTGVYKPKHDETDVVNPAGTAVMQLLSGPGAGSELVLDRSLTTVGKPGIQVAVITRRDNGYYFTQVEGETAPLINGKSAGGHAHLLKPHDIVELAETKMEFYYK